MGRLNINSRPFNNFGECIPLYSLSSISGAEMQGVIHMALWVYNEAALLLTPPWANLMTVLTPFSCVCWVCDALGCHQATRWQIFFFRSMVHITYNLIFALISSFLPSFLGNTGVWSQGLTLARQVLLSLNLLCLPIFQDRVLWTICLELVGSSWSLPPE
jgi:hypothetical protein